jgi:hypothetical protein
MLSGGDQTDSRLRLCSTVVVGIIPLVQAKRSTMAANSSNNDNDDRQQIIIHPPAVNATILNTSTRHRRTRQLTYIHNPPHSNPLVNIGNDFHRCFIGPLGGDDT